MKKPITLGLLVLAMISPAFSQDRGNDRGGGRDGGGGDPYAQQFVELGKKLSEFFKLNPFGLKLSFSALEFKNKVDLIDKSIKDETIPDKVEFTDDKLKDQFGVEKPAVFDRAEDNVRVNRQAWKGFSPAEKLIQITMEITGLLKAPLRYENAAALVESRAEIISKIVINELAEYQIPGWHVIGGDPSEFSKINEKNIIIDGGVLGNGEANHPTLEFFKAPLKNEKWVRKIVEGWASKGSAAYFLVAAPNHDRIVLVSIHIAIDAQDVGNKNADLMANAYMIKLEKTHSVFSGPCAEPEKLSPVDRIRTCYLDQQIYYPHDDLLSTIMNRRADENKVKKTIEELVTGVGSEVESYFSKNQKSLLAALREHFISDYSGAIIPTRLNGHIQVRHAAAGAHGLKSSLAGPFEETPFWIKTDDVDKEDLKLYEAAKTLANNGFVFIDHNVRCREIEGPVLLKRSSYLQLERDRKCLHTMMGGDFRGELYEALNKNGFQYDEAKSIWTKNKN